MIFVIPTLIAISITSGLNYPVKNEHGLCRLRDLGLYLNLEAITPQSGEQYKTPRGGRPHGQVVKFTHSPSAAQGFAGLDPGCRHGTACQATLRQHPTCHN